MRAVQSQRRELFRRANIFFDIRHSSTDGAVDAVLRDDDAAVEVEALAQCALPEPNRLGVGNRRKLVKQQYF